MGKGKKKQHVPEQPANPGRRRFLIAAGAALAAAGTTYALWPRDKTPLQGAMTLGPFPIPHRSGKGRSVIYVTQNHPHAQTVMTNLNMQLEDRFFQSNIDDVLTAAFEAYDRHGIHAILLEGIGMQTVQQYNAEGKVRLVRRSQGENAHASKVEELINGRKWRMYPDAVEMIEHLMSVERPVMDVFHRQFNLYKADAQREQEWLLRNPGKGAEAQARADARRIGYKSLVDEARRKHESAIIEVIYHARDRSVLSTAKNALRTEPGILVVYGFGHASTLREAARKQDIPFIAAEDPKLIEEIKNLSLADLIQPRYSLPRIRLAQ